MGLLGWLLSRKPRLPPSLRVTETHYLLDGGTTIIEAQDPSQKTWQITLTQHMIRTGWFCRSPGRLYVEGYKIPFRSELEQELRRLLHASLEELRQREEEEPVESPWAEQMKQRGAIVLFGSPDLEERGWLSPKQFMIRNLEEVIKYVESDKYGKITG